MMRQSHLPAVVIPLGLISALLSGCGEANTGPRASVTGKVSFEGKPIAIGYLNFLPADGNGPTQATEIIDGEYSASGIPVGKKKLVVQSGTDAATKVYANPGAVKGDANAVDVPSNALGNSQEFDLKEGSQTIDLVLKRPNGVKAP